MNADVLQNYRNPFCTAGTPGGNPGNEGFRFEENGSGNFNVRVGNDAGASHAGYTLTSSLTAGQWHHVAVTWEDTTNSVKGYLNGEKKADVTHTAFATNFGDVEIGRGFSTTNNPYPSGITLP